MHTQRSIAGLFSYSPNGTKLYPKTAAYGFLPFPPPPLLPGFPGFACLPGFILGCSALAGFGELTLGISILAGLGELTLGLSNFAGFILGCSTLAGFCLSTLAGFGESTFGLSTFAGFPTSTFGLSARITFGGPPRS